MQFEEENKTMGDLLRENIQKGPRRGDTFRLKPEEQKGGNRVSAGREVSLQCSNTEVGKAFTFGSMPGTVLGRSLCNW